MSTSPGASAAPHVPEDLDLGALRDLADLMAREAGHLIVAQRPERLGVADTKSSETDVVTVMDRRSEELLRSRIAEHRPDDAVLGEENGVSSGTSGLTWVIDPIDGTVNYLYGHPLFAVSVAVCAGDVMTDGAWWPLAGAVHAPMTAETFVAASGQGAQRRRPGHAEEELRVSGCERLELALVGTGFGYSAHKRAMQAKVLEQLMPRIRDVRRGGSAALDLCYVGAGRLDAYYESGINAWDQAAGQLVATEAGAVLSGPEGQPAGKELVVVAAPGVHGDLRNCILSNSR